VDQRQVPQFRPGGAHEFNGAVTDAAATMNCEPARFVEDEQAFVLIYDLLLDGRDFARRSFSGSGVDPGRRNAHLVPVGKTVFGPHPATVYPYLTTAQDPVQAPFRQPRQFPPEKVIDTLSGELRINANLAHTAVPGTAPVIVAGSHEFKFILMRSRTY